MSRDKVMVGHKEVIALCHVEDRKDFAGYRVENDGLYPNIPKDDSALSGDDMAACVPRHPTSHCEKSALPLPCTLGQLRALLPDGGIDEDAVEAMLGEREHLTGWYDATLDADMWFGLASLTSREAAMLLCQLNPHDDNCDPATRTTDETGPEDFKRLLRVFEDLEKAESKARALPQWLAVAHDKRLKCHSWIDAYALARNEELPDNSGSEGDAPKGGAGGAAKPEWVRQAREIGTEWMLAEEKRTKKRPGIVAIAKYVEGEFKHRDIRSKRLNDYLDWQSIKKEIAGITGRKPGDNFKKAMGNPQRKKHSPNVRAQ